MKRSLTFSASALCLAALALPATAQDSAESEELRQDVVTVTVQKREQALIDVPVAVSSVDGETLSDLGLAEFDELARFIPGFEVQEQSPNNPGFVIRGLTSDSGASNIEPRIAVFQDGVSISRSRGSIVELFDIERVEVAKGPQPTLFGRGALIGGVNIIQAKPQYDFAASATLGFGNENERFAEGFVTGPIIDDTLAFRLSARLRERDGYVESLNPNEEDFNSQDMKAIRGSLRFTPTADFSLDLIANYQEDNPSGTSFKSGAFDPLPGASREAWEPANLNSFGDFVDGDLGLDREVWGITALADYQINDSLSLTSITGYREFESYEVFDPDGFGLPIFAFVEDAEGEQFSQELRLNFDYNDSIRGFVGANYFDEDGSQAVPLSYDERALQALLGGFLVPPNVPSVDALPAINLNPLAGGLPLKPIHNEIFTNFGETTSYEVFGDVSVDMGGGFELTGGLRYTWDEKTSGLLVELPEGPSNLTFGGIFVQPTAGLPNADANGLIETEDDFDDLTFRLAGKLELSDNVNLFANVSRGRRPEVLTASAGSPDAGFATLKAELVDAMEAGVKGVYLDGSLNVNASLYRYDYKDFQDTVVEGGLIRAINAGDAESNGAEIEVFYTPNEMFDVTATYGWNETRFKDDGGPFSGNRLRLSPDHTAAIAARAHFDTPIGKLTLVPNATWQSKVYFDNDQREDLSQDGYVLINFNANLDITDRYSVSAYINNAFDEEYLIDAGNTGDTFGIPTFISGKPQFYGIRFTADF
ncbi:MAG: TonB-dependent receptor [Pseudomonadota bacterium]